MYIAKYTDIYICIFVYIYIYIYFFIYICKSKYISKSKFGDIVEGDPNTPFSIGTTARCKGGRYSFPWIVPLYP